LTVLIITLFTVHCLLFTVSHAKVYIDITEPAFRKLPVSISHSGSVKAKEIAGIVEDDLDFSGIFYPISPDILGAEIKVNITVDAAEQLTVDADVFDLLVNKEIFSKKYTSPIKILRALAHSISNDIFHAVTGKKGGFRTKISFVGSTTNRKQLYLTDWDGYNPVRVVSRGLSISHTWTPDGLKIVYSSERDKKWGIYQLDLRNYRERRLFISKGLNLVGSISRKNRMAFSSSKDGNSEIYVLNIGKSRVKNLTKSFGIDVTPIFSPDGSEIAFVSDRGGSPQIYIMDSKGRTPRRLTFEGSYNTSPAWSPDGKWITYVGMKNGKNQIFMIKSDRSDFRQLTDSGNNENPTFSPNGLLLAFDSDRDGPRGIYLMSVRGDSPKRVTPRSMKATNPKWSPFIR
jgi:TolB protein